MWLHVHSVSVWRFQDIGEGTAEVDILEWYVKVGETVEQFTPLCKVQSDKATTDISSPLDGVITELCYAENDIATVGEPLLHIDVAEESDAADEEVPTAEKDVSAPPAAATDDSASSVLRAGMDNSKPGKVFHQDLFLQNRIWGNVLKIRLHASIANE